MNLIRKIYFYLSETIAKNSNTIQVGGSMCTSDYQGFTGRLDQVSKTIIRNGRNQTMSFCSWYVTKRVIHWTIFFYYCCWFIFKYVVMSSHDFQYKSIARARERERDFHYLKHMELNIREIQWFHFNLSFLFSDYYRQMCWKKMTERIWKINRLYIILIIPQITHSCILLIKVYTMTKRECSTYDPLLSLMNMHVVLIILSTTTKS